MKRYNKQMH